MIQVTNIQYVYDSNFIIDNISFNLGKGETLAVVGPSGSGKTTVLKLILGAIVPDYGSIVIDDVDVTKIDINKRKIGYCPQDQLLFPHLNVFENIAIGLRGKYSKTEIKDRVESLANMGGIKPLLKRKSTQLSGGQKQRVSILRALAIQPNLLLLDEPFHNLDAQIKNQIVNYIKKIQILTNISVILVTHDMSEAKSLADKILILNDGKMIQIGTPRDLLFSPNCYEVAKIMGLPNVFLVKNNSGKNADESIVLSFGELHFTGITTKNVKALYIDPKNIKINQNSENSINTFDGIVKSINPDLLTQKNIISIQIQSKNAEYEEGDDLEENIQIINDLQENSIVKFQKLRITIDIEAVKLFQN